MNSKKLIIILICIMLLSISATFSFYSFYVIEDKKSIYMDLTISDHGGFNLDPDALHFGMSMSPGKVERAFNVSHKSDHPLLVEVTFVGDLGEWAEAEENSFILEPNVNKPVNVIIIIPEGVEMGDYDGHVIVYFKRVLF